MLVTSLPPQTTHFNIPFLPEVSSYTYTKYKYIESKYVWIR